MNYKGVEYQAIVAIINQYEGFLHRSTSTLLAFSIPLGAVTLGFGDGDQSVRFFAAFVGTFFSVMSYIATERIRIVFWKTIDLMKTYEKKMDLTFWGDHEKLLFGGTAFLNYTPSAIKMRTVSFFLSGMFFLVQVIRNWPF
jgi:hypothetical protein